MYKMCNNLFYVLLFFLCINIVYMAVDEELIDYYVNLIKTEENKMRSYKQPINAEEYREKDFKIKDYGSYDYIVVGIGSAGAAVASKLSENPIITVLALEAGDFESDYTDIPEMAGNLIRTKYNWYYTTVPQTSGCLGFKNRGCPYARGKGFGGSSIINGLVYSRGSRSDYDEWGALSPGWSYSDILPFFKEIENATSIHGNPLFHGFDGPYNVEFSRYNTPHINAFLKGSEELGYQLGDYNAANEFVVSKAELNLKYARRLTSAGAFLLPILGERPNLFLSGNSYVTQIHIRNKEVKGVYFVKDGNSYYAAVKKEVIVSGGTIATPQILMLSGVGPRKQLESFGIKVVVDLPVGENFHDHATFAGVTFLTNTSVHQVSLRELVREFLYEKTGELTLAHGNAGVGYFNIYGKATPDIELLVKPPVNHETVSPTLYDVDLNVGKILSEGANQRTTFKSSIIFVRSKSRGWVKLRSSNPFDYPLIDPRILSDEYDLNALYEGVKLVKKFIKTEAFRKLDVSLQKPNLPACRDKVMDSEAYWKCLIRQLSVNAFHPIATCKMGPNSQDSVVNEKLQVYGVKGLRVADASIIPFPLACHTNTPAVMIGVRAANFIKNES